MPPPCIARELLVQGAVAHAARRIRQRAGIMNGPKMSRLIAAALLSWLLLAPPLQTGYIPQIDAGAPISHWYVVTSFDSAASCTKAREARITSAWDSVDKTQKVLKRKRRRRLLLWAYLWECVPGEGADQSR